MRILVLHFVVLPFSYFQALGIDPSREQGKS